MKYPLLASHKNGAAQQIRPLSEEEIAGLEVHKKRYFSTGNRFKLFAMMKQNYGAWDRFVADLQDPTLSVNGDIMLELDRLMLNFLSSVNALFNHFKVHAARGENGKSETAAFKKYVKNLEATNPTYAFFSDLRDFVQHCGLPIGSVNRTQNAETGVIVLKVTTDAAWLIENSGDWRRQWRRSGLTKDRGSMDLLAMMTEVRQVLIEEFGKFTATIYGPRLVETHNFFAELQIEAEKVGGEGAQSIVVESFAQQPGAAPGVQHFQVQTSILPQDVLKEIGITITPIDPGK
jgi:hypothetical protein